MSFGAAATPGAAAGAAPGMTINFDGAGYSEKIEEEMRQEDELQKQELRELLEAEMNDDDLLSDEESEEEVVEPEDHSQSDVELHTTDDLSKNLPVTHFSYEQLLTMYKERGDELNRNQLLIEEQSETHHRALRAKDHQIAQLEQQTKNSELDQQLYLDRVQQKENELKSITIELQNLTQTHSHLSTSHEQLKDTNYNLELLNQTLQQQLAEAVSNDSLAQKTTEFERCLHEQSEAADRKMQSMREQITDLQREFNQTELKNGNLEHALKSTQSDLDSVRDEYERLQDRYQRLGEDFTRFKKNTTNPVPIGDHGLMDTNQALNFTETSTDYVNRQNHDGSYLLFNSPSKPPTDQFNQTNHDLRKELERVTTLVKEKQNLIEKSSRDTERLTQDVQFWKKQVEENRESHSHSLRSTVSKADLLNAQLQSAKHREEKLTKKLEQVVNDCDEAKKIHEEKIRVACDLLHVDAVQKMKDLHEAEMEKALSEIELTHSERCKQAQAVIDDLSKQLDEVKSEYVTMSGQKDHLEVVLLEKKEKEELDQTKADKLRAAYEQHLKKLKMEVLEHARSQKERSAKAFEEQIQKDRAKLKTYYLKNV